MTARVARGGLPDADRAAASRARSCARGSATTRPGRRCSSGRWGDARAQYFEDDFERGIIATDALIGTFAGLDDESLRQNRCFLYHVIGNGTGDWDVPVGGMGALTEALAAIAWAAGAEVRLGVRGDRDRDRRRRRRGALRRRLGDARGTCWPTSRRRCSRGCSASRAPDDPAPEGAQLKLNMLLKRLPRLRDPSARPARGVRGDVPRQRVRHPARGGLRAGAAAARCRELAPCEIYCHSLTDPSILGRGAARGRGRRR